MTNLLERDLHLNDLLDRVERLERDVRNYADYAFTISDDASNPQEPDWSTLSGWVVTGGTLQDENGYIKLDPSVPRIQIYPSGYIESSNYIAGSAGFQINGGTAEFNDVVVRGTIYADAGEIGGWSIGASALSSNDVYINSGGWLTLGQSNDIVKLDAQDAAYRLWVGNATAASAPFRVSKAGAITATSGTIGGWTLGASSLTGGSVTLNSAGSISVGTGDDVAKLSAVHATYRLWAGAELATSAPFRVSKSGEVWATNGHFTGEIDANSGHLGSLDVDGVITVGTVTPYIEIDGGNKWIQSSTYTVNRRGFRIQDNGDAEFNNVNVRGALHCAVFIKDLISAHAGSLVVTKSAGKLAADCLIGTDNLVVDDPPVDGTLFDVDDIIQLKEESATGIWSTWIEIDSVVGGAGSNEYTYTYKSGSTGVTYRKGTTAVDWGPNTGGGGVWMTADQTNAPYLSVFTHTGNPWSSGFNDRVVLGNLNGRADYSSDTYGIFIGDYAGNRWMSYDPTNSLRIRGDAIIDGTIAAMALPNELHTLLMAESGLLLIDFQTLKQSGSTWYVKGSRGQLCTLEGAIHQEPGRFVNTRGLVFERDTTNQAYNPSFETGDTSNWTLAQGGTGATLVASTDYARFGDYSVKLTLESDYYGTANCDQLVAVGDGESITGSAWCKTNFADRFRLRLWDTTASTSRGNSEYCPGNGQWTRISVSWTNDTGSSKTMRLNLMGPAAAGVAYAYYDGINWEKHPQATSYCDGDQGRGYSWTGTAHASTSIRDESGLNLDNHTELISGINEFSIRSVVQMPFAYDDVWQYLTSVSIWDVRGADNNNRIRLSYDTSSNKMFVYINGNNRLEWAADFEAGDWLDVLVTLDFTSDTYALSINGVQKDTDTTALTAPALTDWYVGCTYGGPIYQDSFGGVFAEYSVFDKELTEGECAALAKQMRATVDMGAFTKPGVYILDGAFRLLSSTTGQRIDMLPYGMGIYAGDGETGIARLLGGFVTDADGVPADQVLDPDGTDFGWFGYDSSNVLHVGWYASGANAGKVVIGGGKVVFDQYGITFESTEGSPSASLIRFEDNDGDIVSYFYGYDTGSVYYSGFENRSDLIDANYTSVSLCTVRGATAVEHVGLLAVHNKATNTPYVEIRTQGLGSNGSFIVTASGTGSTVYTFRTAGTASFDTGLMIGSATIAPSKDLHIRTTLPTIRLDDKEAGNVTAAAGYIEFGSSSSSWNRHGFFGFSSESTDYMVWNNEDGERSYIYVKDNANACFYNNGSSVNVFNVGANSATNDTKMSTGLKIGQGSYDNNILSLFSSDVGHNFSTYADAACFAAFSKTEGAAGGLVIRGYKDSAGVAGYALNFQGYLDENANTDKDSTGFGVVNIRGSQQSGGGGASLVSNGNILSIQNYTTTTFLFDAEGSAHAEIEWIAMDDYDDIALLKSLEHHVMSNGDPVKEKFGEFLAYNKDALEKLNLAHFEEDRPGRAMVNFTRLSMLLTGAVKQLNDRLGRYERALVDLGVDPKLLEAYN